MVNEKALVFGECFFLLNDEDREDHIMSASYARVFIRLKIDLIFKRCFFWVSKKINHLNDLFSFLFPQHAFTSAYCFNEG